MKKLISILLVMVMTFTLSGAVFANQEENIEEDVTLENVKGEIITLYDRNVYHDYEVLVITFDEKYTTKGENFIVHFDVYKNNSMTGTPTGFGYASESQHVSLEIFEYEGKRYPQLFVTIPYGATGGHNLNNAVIRLDEGIFLTDDGEMSCKVEIPYKDFNRNKSDEKIKLSCKGNQITRVSNNAGYNDIWLLQNSTVSAEAVISNSEYADVWMANSKINFYWFDSLVECENNSILVEEVGNYTVEFKLCDQVSFKKYFVSEEKTDRYFQNLGESTEALLLSPITFVVSVILFIFVPGFGTWIGSTAAIASLCAIPNFFITLFGGNLTTEYTF